MNIQESPPARDGLALAATILGRLHVLFDQAVSVLAMKCSLGHKLDAQRLDEQQFPSYEIALACADLLAAETVVGNAGDQMSELALDEPLAMAQDAFRRLATDIVAPMAEEIHRANLTVPEGLLQTMREMGVFGLSIPEQYGGSAPAEREDTLLMIVVTEALSEASLAAAGSPITRPEILARALLTGGTESQKTHWLPKLAAGDPLCAIAITEPDFGSDVASLALKGTPTEGGWLLNGSKTWCTFAGKAGLLMVVVRTDPDKSAGHRGLSVLLVEKPSYGRNDGRPDANCSTRLGCHARRLARRHSICARPEGLRRCVGGISPDTGEDCQDGRDVCGIQAAGIPRRPAAGPVEGNSAGHAEVQGPFQLHRTLRLEPNDELDSGRYAGRAGPGRTAQADDTREDYASHCFSGQ